jgi:hypothetical protein
LLFSCDYINHINYNNYNKEITNVKKEFLATDSCAFGACPQIYPPLAGCADFSELVGQVAAATCHFC